MKIHISRVDLFKIIRRVLVVALFVLFIADHFYTLEAQKYGYGVEVNPILNFFGIKLVLWLKYIFLPIIYFYFVNKPQKRHYYIIVATIIVYLVQLAIHVNLYNNSFHNLYPIFGS